MWGKRGATYGEKGCVSASSKALSCAVFRLCLVPFQADESVSSNAHVSKACVFVSVSILFVQGLKKDLDDVFVPILEGETSIRDSSVMPSYIFVHMRMSKVFLSPTAPVSPICRTPLFPYLTFYSFSALGRVLLHCRRRTLDEARARAL